MVVVCHHAIECREKPRFLFLAMQEAREFQLIERREKTGLILVTQCFTEIQLTVRRTFQRQIEDLLAWIVRVVGIQLVLRYASSSKREYRVGPWLGRRGGLSRVATGALS